VFGSGPGTFAIPYQKLKRPESEMSRMVHNDYLEQASDSGLIGFLTYAAFIAAGLGRAARDLSGRAKATTSESASAPMKQDTSMNPGGQRFGVWLGLAGWALQSLFEFGLYIPALAWVAFALFGWMLGSSGKVAIASAKVMKHS